MVDYSRKGGRSAWWTASGREIGQHGGLLQERREVSREDCSRKRDRSTWWTAPERKVDQHC